MSFEPYEILERETIGRWFDAGIWDQQRYLLVYCDTLDGSYYSVSVEDDAEYRRKLDDPYYGISNMQRLMEVYDLTMDKETQLAEYRAMHSRIAGYVFDKTMLSVDEAPFQHD